MSNEEAIFELCVKKNKYSIIQNADLANQMISDLGVGPCSANGDRSSSYFTIAQGTNRPEDFVSVALIENVMGPFGAR